MARRDEGMVISRDERVEVNPTINVEAGGDKTAKKGLAQATGWMFIGAIAGAVIGVLLSLFAIYNIGLSGLLGTIVLGFSGAIILACCGFIMGMIDYWLPDLLKTIVTILFIICVLVGLFRAIIIMEQAGTLPEYLKFAHRFLRDSKKAGSRWLSLNIVYMLISSVLYLSPLGILRSSLRKRLSRLA